MKLGIFDSGLGGLLIARSIHEKCPDIDILYFGDTLHLPYGNRSSDAIYEYSRRAMDFLFDQGCALIITACNTVSASALRRLQQEYLPASPYAERRILGVVVPTLECAIDAGYKRLGLIGTNYTIQSNIYREELQKIDPDIELYQEHTPLLVPLIENNGMEWMVSVLETYLAPLKAQGVECLILGCTHYPFLKGMIGEIMGANVSILSQDEIIPDKLQDYLERHPEISGQITRNGVCEFLVSDITDGYKKAAHKICESDITIEQVSFLHDTNRYMRQAA